MTKNDFILKASEWFLYDLHTESLQLLTEADDDARHIEGVCYNAMWQDETAKKILTSIHDLALDFYNMYEAGKKDKVNITMEETLNALKKVSNEREVKE